VWGEKHWMAIDLKIDEADKCVHVNIEGRVTDQEIQDAVNELRTLFDSHRLDDSWLQVVDTSKITSVDEVTTSVIRDAAREGAWPSGSLRVIIAPSDLAFGLARMYQIQRAQRDGSNLHVVRSREEADKLIAESRSKEH